MDINIEPTDLDKRLEEAAKDRHPAVKDVCQFFRGAHLDTFQQIIVEGFQELILSLLWHLKDCPQLTHALNDLLHAKDAAVRASL